MIPNLIATSPRIIISEKIKTNPKKYEIDYTCKLLSIEKAPNNFKKLSILSNLKSKQRIWEFCKEVVK